MEVKELLRELKEGQAKIMTILLGNGDSGLCEDVRNNTKEIDYIKDKIKPEAKKKKLGLREWLIIVAIILAIINKGDPKAVFDFVLKLIGLA